ncbi:hypothetical protein AB0383_09135 [Amycolatopsis sp. NPDC051373]|uniref:hypothetical protein n=1 Tax=Amycolatopsis sp. NPDC051373 TaxID=3155801 RepID=UPI00344C89C3
MSPAVGDAESARQQGGEGVDDGARLGIVGDRDELQDFTILRPPRRLRSPGSLGRIEEMELSYAGLTSRRTGSMNVEPAATVPEKCAPLTLASRQKQMDSWLLVRPP